MDFLGGQAFPGGAAGLFAQFGFGGGPHDNARRPDPRSYDDYFKAYSVAMLPGNERDNVSYGGKIIMPTSALARLTQLDLESPWMFKLSNPANPAASTHAGVLEFIAEEGVVHLPQWMMKTLRLDEGDPIRVTGCDLQKGKFVKLQAQTVDFLEISDPKAVLEQALRHFSALTQGDIIEISYNTIKFGLLVMETQPGGEGISVLDTDLEVDFAAPVGYVEPERPKPPPPPTMASKLNIDVNASTPGSSRPSSALGGTFTGAGKNAALSKGGDQWESFKGKGETLGGRKTKGKGISHRQVEEVTEGSKIIRTDKHRVVTSDSLEANVSAPAPLNLPFGQLFFGFNITPYTPQDKSKDPSKDPSKPSPPTFNGSGNTLTGRPSGASSDAKGKGREESTLQSAHTWGTGGHSLSASRPTALGSANRSTGAGGASVPIIPQRRPQTQTRRSPSPVEVADNSDDDYYDDGMDEDDVIDIDSD